MGNELVIQPMLKMKNLKLPCLQVEKVATEPMEYLRNFLALKATPVHYNKGKNGINIPQVHGSNQALIQTLS